MSAPDSEKNMPKRRRKYLYEVDATVPGRTEQRLRSADFPPGDSATVGQRGSSASADGAEASTSAVLKTCGETSGVARTAQASSVDVALSDDISDTEECGDGDDHGNECLSSEESSDGGVSSSSDTHDSGADAPECDERQGKKRKKYLYEVDATVPGRTEQRLRSADFPPGDSATVGQRGSSASADGAEASTSAVLETCGETSGVARTAQGPSVDLALSDDISDTEECGDGDDHGNECLSSEESRDGGVSSSSDTDDSGADEPECDERQSTPLYPGSQLSLKESLLMITAFSLRHKLSKEATEDLLHLVELHLPCDTATATTSFVLLKQFRSFLLSPSQHFYCPYCKVYIGKDIANGLKCLECDSTYSVEELQKKSSFFVALSIEEQLRNILESKCSKVQLGSEATKSTSYDVSSIRQSLCYSRLPLSPYDVTLTINTDGFPMYKSSGYSMWPLELAVNELPEHERWDNMLLGAIWFGREKPNINCFLRPFVEEMNHLSSTGFAWTDEHKVSRTTRVFPGPVTVDTVARALVMNMTMFNGAYGCAWCESEGTVVAKGSGHSRVYPLHQRQPKERTAVFSERMQETLMCKEHQTKG
ncbi:uncharacterized protein [Dermacentor albipictus]|uniref:uncharacterized protein n=1 Tax=Dermacentor albipictus TaxID=60249 RepID=UPI0038FC82C4